MCELRLRLPTKKWQPCLQQQAHRRRLFPNAHRHPPWHHAQSLPAPLPAKSPLRRVLTLHPRFRLYSLRPRTQKASRCHRPTRRLGRLQHPSEPHPARRANRRHKRKTPGATGRCSPLLQKTPTPGLPQARKTRLDPRRPKRDPLPGKKRIRPTRNLRPRKLPQKTPPRQSQYPTQNPPTTPSPARPRPPRIPRQQFLSSALRGYPSLVTRVCNLTEFSLSRLSAIWLVHFDAPFRLTWPST